MRRTLVLITALGLLFDHAIRAGLERVEAGAQGEHKLARGYLPVPTQTVGRSRRG